MNLNIEVIDAPTEADYQAILTPLRVYNQTTAGLADPEKLALLIKDEAGQAIGGLDASVFGQWLFIEMLIVPEVARGQGLGTRLMNMAEEIARQRGCVGLWLDTFSFQALDFYLRLGFSVFGELPEHPPGHQRYFMKKRLDSQPGASEAGIAFTQTAPILRMFDTQKAKEFYLDFLGFQLDWEHRFGADFPLYMQVSRAGLTLHLSEHHGDASPGSCTFVTMRGIEALQRELIAKAYRFMKPEIEKLDWGHVMTVTDPFGNRLRFNEPVPA